MFIVKEGNSFCFKYYRRQVIINRTSKLKNTKFLSLKDIRDSGLQSALIFN